MALSSDLISQFVQVTKSEKQKKESTVYGTVTRQGGKTYVYLDGSELLTPVSTTIDAADGDRVVVLIKNHNAIVTGSISSPAGKSSDVASAVKKAEEASRKIDEYDLIVADKVSTDRFEAEVARIDSLTTDNVKVKERLTAAEASITNLDADNATINGKLTAAEGDIEKLKSTSISADIVASTYATIESLNATNTKVNNLEATYGTFHDATVERLDAAEANIDSLETNKLDAATAEITYAKISDLNATNANVGNLEADVAGIDTLIFGSASGDTIQSSFANAVIAQVGDAQIKSAMIENIAADKIVSGDIITNNVHVKSNDGKLLISDETLQISDNTRVRVQIGKDSSNDYSINIWDTDGNLMFSKGGITDSAIKQAIIRNDMVSDTANISAYKLDINTLFKVINESSNTIKSTRIYLDDEKQTLDVAFKSLKTETTELGENITSQGTEISTIQGQISSKVWLQDINDATTPLDTKVTNLNTQYTSLKQETDNISATVANHTTTLEKKADSSMVTTVSDKVTELETNLSGFKTTVSSTYATKTDVDSLQNRVDTAETNISQNDSEIESLASRTTVVENKFAGYATTEAMNSAISQSADSIRSSVSTTYATKAELESIENTGRNLVAGTDDVTEYISNATGQSAGYQDAWVGTTITAPTETTYVASFDAKADGDGLPILCYFCDPDTTTGGIGINPERNDCPAEAGNGLVSIELGTEWSRCHIIWKQTAATTPKKIILGRNRYTDNVYIRAVKFEVGSNPTPWSRAPEDVATLNDISVVQSSSDLIETRLSTAESLIEQLSDSLAVLIRDESGESLLVQTEEGWTFSTSQIQDSVNEALYRLDDLTNSIGNVDATVGILQQAVNDLGVLSDYVKIGVYEGEPCIELGESDSDFKLLITNTRIMFMEGSDVPAYINNQSLFIKKAVVEEELQQGEFVWKVRNNGNLGLMWKGVTS